MQLVDLEFSEVLVQHQSISGGSGGLEDFQLDPDTVDQINIATDISFELDDYEIEITDIPDDIYILTCLMTKTVW